MQCTTLLYCLCVLISSDVTVKAPKPISSPSLSFFLCPVALSIPAPSLPFLSLLSPSVLLPAHFWRSVRMRS